MDSPQGTARSEPWLSLEDDRQRTRSLIVRLAHEIWESVLVGNQAPIVKARYQRMCLPDAGDLVVERSTYYLLGRSKDSEWYTGVGYLVACRFEPFDSETSEKVWYVQYGPEPDDVCRWVNADFVAIDTGSFAPHELGLDLPGDHLLGDAKPWPGYCQNCRAPLDPPNSTTCHTCHASDADE